MPLLFHIPALAGGVALLAFLFAKVEIQIEGDAGWAANLPTWRVENHAILKRVMGGRPLTGYHAWMFTFMAAVFHLPLFMLGTFSWYLEARIAGALMLFWILEDFLWFVLNPAYGIRRFRNEHIQWHNHWIGPVPVDYLVYVVLGLLLMTISFRGGF